LAAALVAGRGGAGALTVGVAFVGAGLDIAQQPGPPSHVGSAAENWWGRDGRLLVR
jgi:hypothetical protein